MVEQKADGPANLAQGSSVCDALIQQRDWSRTALGAIESWSPTLRTSAAIVLRSPVPMVLLWGERGVMLYNDAYSTFAGGRHPELLGSEVRIGWPEVAAFNDNVMRQALSGQSLSYRDLELTLHRHGAPEQVFMDLDYSPVCDATGRPCGVLCVLAETTERVLAQQRAAASEAKLSAVLQQMPLGVSAAEVPGAGFVLLNETGVEMLGTRHAPKDENDYQGFGALCADGTPYLPEQYPLARAAATGEVVRGEPMLYRKPDGRLLNLEVNASRVCDADGNPLLAVCTFSDVTEQRLTEQRLRESEARLQATFDAVPLGIVLAAAPAGEIIGGNAQVETIFGHPILPSADTEGYAEWFGHHPDGRAVEGDEYPLARALRGEEERPELDVIYHRPDGTRRWVRLAGAPIRDDDGEIAGAVVACLDIDRKQRAELALQALNEQLETQVAERTADRDRMWRLSTDVMLVARFDATITAVNPAWENLLGWSEGELLERAFTELVHPDDLEATLAEAGRLAEGFTTLRFENRYRCKNGSYRWLSWIAVPEAGLIHAVGRDVTVERQAEAELAEAQDALRQSQKLEAMGQLTGGVAHDFNNLLSPIIGGLDLLERRGVGDERARRTISGALAAAERAKVLVQRLLAFARRQPLQPSAVDIGTLVCGMESLISSTIGPRVKLSVDIAGGVPPARADINQVEMALLNLSVNARDAMPDGGELIISVACAEHNDGRSDLPPGRYTRLSVRDTGIGMTPDVLAKAVEPFFSTKGVGRGTGLGLSMVHGLAAQLGGALRLQSRLGWGTIVELWLPEMALNAAQETHGMPDAIARLKAGTALVVDDEDLVRSSTREMLEDLGFDVSDAIDAAGALALFESGRSFDVLVTDHLMPGMTGTQLVREVQHRWPDTRVLIVSGYAEVDGLTADVPRLSKPFRGGDLANALADLLPT